MSAITREGGSRGGARLRRACLVLALFLAALMPVLITPLPPILDYPNHMARMHILSGGGTGEWYRVAWAPLANLALDLIVPPLAAIMPLPWAGRVFLLLTLGLLGVGTILLHRALHGRVGGWAGLWPLLGLFFVYDHILLIGLLNYLFGVGLALLALASHVAMARRRLVGRLAATAGFALALYFAHLFALGVFALCVLGYELATLPPDRPRRAPALAMITLPFVPPALLVWFGPHEGATTAAFGPIARKADLLFSVLDSTWRPFDIATALALLGLLVLGFWRGKLKLHPAMRLPLALLFLAYLAMPTALMTTSNVDRRLPIALALTLVAATRPMPTPGDARRTSMIAAVLIALFAGRMGLETLFWREQSAAMTELTPALALIEPGSSVVLGYPVRALQMVPRAAPIAHLPLMAVTGRDAFVPTFFANPAQQPVVLTPAAEALARDAKPDAVWRALVQEPDRPNPSVMAAIERYDYVLLLDHKPFEAPPRAWLAPLYERPNWRLYRNEKRR